MNSNSPLWATLHPTRIEYSERPLTSLNGDAMVAVGLVSIALAVWRLSSITDALEGSALAWRAARWPGISFPAACASS